MLKIYFTRTHHIKIIVYELHLVSYNIVLCTFETLHVKDYCLLNTASLFHHVFVKHL